MTRHAERRTPGGKPRGGADKKARKREDWLEEEDFPVLDGDLLLLEPALFPQVEGALRPEQFSAPVLARIYALLCQRHREGRSTQLAALTGALTADEMSHLVRVMDQPEALAHSSQALRDYIEIIQTEALKRGGGGQDDPLLAAREKFRERKAYGG